MLQVRALLYTGTLTNAIMEAMGATEAAVMEALTSTHSQKVHTAAREAHQQHLARVSQPVHEALSKSGFSGKVWNQQQSGNCCVSLTCVCVCQKFQMMALPDDIGTTAELSWQAVRVSVPVKPVKQNVRPAATK